MRSWKPRSELHTSLAAALMSQTKPAAASLTSGTNAAAAPPDLPAAVIAWLVQLTLLYGVPFEYLVADSRLLPTESLRFFYVDRNWLDRLVDGALSVGTGSSRENVFNEQFYESVYSEIDRQQVQFRFNLRRRAVPNDTPAAGTFSGFLFRSVIVSTWPGLEVQGFLKNKLLSIVRQDRLSPGVMLVIFNGVPDTVNMIEPSEGLHMGVVDTDDPATVKVVLRGLGYGNFPAGIPISEGSGFLSATTQYRSGTGQPAGVLNIGALVGDMQSKMRTKGAIAPDGKITPGAFGIELVLGAGLQAFTRGAPDCAKISGGNGDGH